MGSDEARFRILGIPGSLRRGSYNRGLLRAAVEVAPEGVEIQIAELGQIPLYNADVEANGAPEPVRELKDWIARVDALLIATPEYNYSIPGVLKNAIDWASRPPSETPLRHKPIALMGFVFTESFVMLKPELMVPRAPELFDADGNLQDPAIRDRVRAVIEALIGWTRRLRTD